MRPMAARLASGCTGPAERHLDEFDSGILRALRGAGAGAVPASPAIAEGLPALVGDRDRVLQLDEAATGMRDRRLDRDHHAGLKRQVPIKGRIGNWPWAREPG